MTRIDMLKRIDELNRELGFIGCRGEMYMSDDKVKKLMEKLEEEIGK